MMTGPGVPVCVGCKVIYQCEKNSVLVRDPHFKDGFEGTWWRADLYRCPGCGSQIIIGFSEKGFHEPTARMLALNESHVYYFRYNQRDPEEWSTKAGGISASARKSAKEGG